ncbi:ABC transporter permease [Brevibacillus sp. B_LB10_24]|uniref:ABC transporter permease n=1 Tax=Brevibacillus sp. B_LB10_24 TaxID=3380645 RepID=UPI0038BA22B9
MHSLYANVLNETHKLFRQKRTKLALLLTVLAPVLSAVLLDSFHSNTGIFFGRDFTLLMLGLFSTVFLPLFLFMTAADSFAGEVAARTLKNVLVQPIARSKIFASKVIAITVFTAALLAIVWLVSLLAGLVFVGGITWRGLADSLTAYPAAFVSMTAVGMAAVFVAQWFRSGVGAFALCVFLYIAAKLLPFIFPQMAAWSIFSYTDWHMLWIGNAASFGRLFNAFVFLLSSCIITYTAGWYLFEKKQI